MKTCFQLFGFEIGPGWESIVKPLVEYCQKNGVEILQIKEKFGGLRFYVGPAKDELYDMIRAAEEESYKTCELCGHPGKVRSGAWIRTRCDNCL